MTTATKQRYIVRLKFREKDVSQWIVDRPRLDIGRTPDNDIVIDSLAVSRHHATIEESPEGLVIRDCGSANGLEVDGRICTEAVIGDGTRVMIGKHTLWFEAEATHGADTASPIPGDFQATMMVTETPRLADPACLVETGATGETKYPIDTTNFLMGKSEAVDVHLDGMFTASFHVSIKVQDGEHRIFHLNGRRKLKVNGETVSECLLRDGDEIEVAGRRFRFQLSS